MRHNTIEGIVAYICPHPHNRGKVEVPHKNPPCAREIFCVPSCVQGHCICKLDPKRWHPCARCWVETAPARGKDMGSHPLWGKGENNSCKLGVHATCGPLGPGQNHGRLSHEIAVAEDVLDDKRCLTASWYENVAHAWSSGSCWKGRGPLQYTCKSSRSMSNMSSQLNFSEQSNSLNCWWLHMYSLWGLNPRPMAHKTIALTTELREPPDNIVRDQLSCLK